MSHNSIYSLSTDPSISHIAMSSNTTDHFKQNHGIEYLLYLQKFYEDKLEGHIFCRNSCPFPDIRAKFDADDVKMRRLHGEITDMINTYNESCVECEKIQMYPENIKNTEDIKFKLCMYKKRIQDIESYNLAQQTAHLFEIGLKHIKKILINRGSDLTKNTNQTDNSGKD